MRNVLRCMALLCVVAFSVYLIACHGQTAAKDAKDSNVTQPSPGDDLQKRANDSSRPLNERLACSYTLLVRSLRSGMTLRDLREVGQCSWIPAERLYRYSIIAGQVPVQPKTGCSLVRMAFGSVNADNPAIYLVLDPKCSEAEMLAYLRDGKGKMGDTKVRDLAFVDDR